MLASHRLRDRLPALESGLLRSLRDGAEHPHRSEWAAFRDGQSFDPLWVTAQQCGHCLGSDTVTSLTPVRRIKTGSGSSNDQPAARRAIVESPAEKPARPSTLGLPRFGRAEWQLLRAYLIASCVVFTIVVIVPGVIGFVRHF